MLWSLYCCSGTNAACFDVVYISCVSQKVLSVKFVKTLMMWFFHLIWVVSFFVTVSVVIIICPVPIAQHETDYEITYLCLSVCLPVCLCVCLHSHGHNFYPILKKFCTDVWPWHICLLLPLLDLAISSCPIHRPLPVTSSLTARLRWFRYQNPSFHFRFRDRDITWFSASASEARALRRRR